MEQTSLVELLKLGADSWNEWRQSNPDQLISLSGCDLSKSNFSGYDFSTADLSYADLSDSEFIGSNFISARLEHANLSGSNLEKSNFIAAELSHADFSRAKINWVKFLTAQFKGTNFSNVDFTGHSLQGMDFRRSCLNGANLVGQDLSAIDFAEADLSQADLTNANLLDSNLQRANLTLAKLNGANLQGSNFKEAKLVATDLSNKNLSGCNFTDADLTECNLRNSNLEQSSFNRSVLTGAKFFKAKISGWSIKHVRCDYAFWDEKGTNPTRYRPREFERLFSESITFSLRYEKFIAPHEYSMLPTLLEHLEAAHWGLKLRIKSLSDEAGCSIVVIAVEDTGGHDPEKLEAELKSEANQLLVAQLAMRQDRFLLPQFKEAMAQVKNRFWPRLLELAADHEVGYARTYTVMLMDLKNFSRWKGEELNEKLTLFRGLIKPILKRWKATYPNMEGDSLRASFQNASVGVACACMIQNVLEAAGFSSRIGMDLGEIFLQHNEVTEQVDLSGEAVNFAARLESVCGSGEVLISSRVWHYVRHQEEFFEFSPQSVKLDKGVGNLRAGEQVHCYLAIMKKALI